MADRTEQDLRLSLNRTKPIMVVPSVTGEQLADVHQQLDWLILQRNVERVLGK